jgi:hypothetical protein
VNFSFKHLDSDTRKLMLDELTMDSTADRLYLGKYLNGDGERAWPDLLRKAISSGDEVSLANDILPQQFWLATYQRRTPSGGYTQARVPQTAPTTLAEGEFVRFYLRGVCRVAIVDSRSVRVVRMKAVADPRPESQAAIGRAVDPNALLADLRQNIGIDTFLGIPAGPNSGIGVELA